MRIIKTKNYDEMSMHVADLIAAQIIMKPKAVIGLATGSTPLGAYKRLVDLYKAGNLDFSEVKTYNLDEYRGLTHDHVQSYHYFMNDNLFNHINIKPENTHVPDGSNPNADDACKEYDEMVEAAGFCDLQLLGIGNNGHIGFNEPADAFTKGTNCIDLTESTIKANSRLFDSIEEVPRQAYTMGVGTIMQAKIIVICASGAAKAEAMKAMIEGPISPECPASVLQLHNDCVVVADEDALSLCSL